MAIRQAVASAPVCHARDGRHRADVLHGQTDSGAPPGDGAEPLPIDAEAEPILFAFIDEICRQVRAPRPRRVYVDCTVNASAGFMRGRLNMLRGDLVLTIGLPLVAGLSIRELGGVLAHEFGHFAQGGGLRLTAIVRGVNAWFGRVGVRTRRMGRQAGAMVEGVGLASGRRPAVARGAVWLSRRVLTGLMLGGHAISCFMMRQMEYDADSYEIKVAGSDAFVRTSIRMRELSAAAHFAYSDMREALDAGTFPANLPTFMVERSRLIPAEVLATSEATVTRRQACSIPIRAMRIASGRRRPLPPPACWSARTLARRSCFATSTR